MTDPTDPTRPAILFVDDEANVLKGLRRLLHEFRGEWDMAFAQSVEEALALLQTGSFVTVVSDINMPDRDGFELLTAIRRDPQLETVPVVMLTGNLDHELKRRALDLGATDLLNKPADKAELVARIRNVLRLKSYQDEIRRKNEELERRVLERTVELEHAQLELIWRLGRAGEFRDSETGNHVVRVGYYSLELANALGVERDAANALFLASPLHDIGKIGIPDDVLLKPDRLTSSEWKVMRLHTRIGADILRGEVVDPSRFRCFDGLVPISRASHNALIETAANIALGHHERWDGDGYPDGVAGEEIPLEARIAAVADVYDALCSVRPYKRAYSQEECLEIMRRGSGNHFDPEVFDAFERSLASFQEIRLEFADEAPSDVQADLLRGIADLARVPEDSLVG